MRKGMTGLAMLVQQILAEDPFGGAVFAFRGRRAGLIKLLWHDGVGLCMLTKRLEQGQFVWPSASARVLLAAPIMPAMLPFVPKSIMGYIPLKRMSPAWTTLLSVK